MPSIVVKGGLAFVQGGVLQKLLSKAHFTQKHQHFGSTSKYLSESKVKVLSIAKEKHPGCKNCDSNKKQQVCATKNYCPQFFHFHYRVIHQSVYLKG